MFSRRGCQFRVIYAAEATDTDERACRILHFGSLRASSGGEEDGTRSRVTYGKVRRRLPIDEDDSTLKKMLRSIVTQGRRCWTKLNLSCYSPDLLPRYSTSFFDFVQLLPPRAVSCLWESIWARSFLPTPNTPPSSQSLARLGEKKGLVMPQSNKEMPSSSECPSASGIWRMSHVERPSGDYDAVFV